MQASLRSRIGTVSLGHLQVTSRPLLVTSTHVRLKHRIKNHSELTRALPDMERNCGDRGGTEMMVSFEMAASWPEIWVRIWTVASSESR